MRVTQAVASCLLCLSRASANQIWDRNYTETRRFGMVLQGKIELPHYYNIKFQFQCVTYLSSN